MRRLICSALLVAAPVCAQFGNNAKKLRGYEICADAPADGGPLTFDAAKGCYTTAPSIVAIGTACPAGMVNGVCADGGFYSPGPWLLQGLVNTAPATPDAGKFAARVDSTAKNLQVLNDAGNTSATVYPQTCPAGQSVTAVAADGTVTCSSTGSYVLTNAGTPTTLNGSGTSGGVMYCYPFGGMGCTTVEANRTLHMPMAASLSKLTVTTQTSLGSGGAVQFYLCKNTCATSATLVLTIAAGSTAGRYSSVAAAVAYAANDSIVVKVVNADSGTLALNGWTLVGQ